MKKMILLFGIVAMTAMSCKKDKFECGVEANNPPADDSSILMIPTAFSPDGNGCNDGFYYVLENIDSLHTEIYSSDNKLIFEADGLAKWWVPDNLETGITLYHYKITAKSHQGYRYYRCGDVYAYKCLPEGFDRKTLIFGDQFEPNQSGSGYHIRDTSICEVMEYCK